MCFGGGNDASDAARRQEEERRRQVEESIAAIDRAFAGRGAQIRDFVNALREEFRTKATKQKDIADRKLRFSLARGGLTGGSAAADAGTLLGEEFTEAILKGERQAQGAGADLESADTAARADLIRLAQGGADVSTAATQAANALRSNIEGARGRSFTQGLGDVFADTRQLFLDQQEAAARRRGLRESEVFADPFSR